MAVIDDLVSSGLSGTQATEVVAVGAGTGSESALVSQGFSSTQAAAIVAGGNIDELVRQGLYGTQAVAVNEAVGTPPGPVTTTYSLGTAYSGTDLGNNGPGGQVRLAFYGPYSGAFTTAMNTLAPGNTVSLVVAGQGTFTVTIAGTYQVIDPDNAYIVANNFGIMPDPGYVFTSITF